VMQKTSCTTVLLISNDDIPGTHDDNTGFEDLYASAIADIETAAQAVMPLMTFALEVTQILTCDDAPTAGLVLLMHNRIRIVLERQMKLSILTGVESTSA